MNNKNNIIKIENLKKVFKNEKEEHIALQDINLEIARGEIFGIIGLSGAGKSTLVRMMNYLEKPTDGNVYFEDKNLGKLKNTELRQVRREIGMIFQNFNLLEQSTVLKNVLFPLEILGMSKSKSIERAKELLKLVDLEEKANEYPSKLSGGQKQRVAIARALATSPKVILCDEATSALDPKTTTQILTLLKRINKELNVTIVIITHQMSVISDICDRVAIIDQSRIVEMGKVEDVFKSPKSTIGQKLILGISNNNGNDNVYANDIDSDKFVNTTGNPCLRLVFNGKLINEPIISSMVLEVGVPINVIFANIKNIKGEFFGQLVVELPKDIILQNKMKKFLEKKEVVYWEVK